MAPHDDVDQEIELAGVAAEAIQLLAALIPAVPVDVLASPSAPSLKPRREVAEWTAMGTFSARNGVARPLTGRTLVGMTAAGLLAFLSLQLFVDIPSEVGGGWLRFLGAAIGYLTLAIPVAFVARNGLPRLALLIPVSYFLVPAILRMLEGGDFLPDTYLPGMSSYEALADLPWVRVGLYFALIAAPMWPSLAGASARLRRVDTPVAAGLAITGMATLILLYVSSVLSTGPLDVATTAATACVAVLLMLAERGTFAQRLVAGIMASGLATYLAGVAASGITSVYWNAIPELASLALVPATIGLAPSVGERVFLAANRPLVLLLAVNVLNVTDAVLTAVGQSRGVIQEANPLISRVGLLPKLILVPVVSWAMYRLRPRWLLVPAILLADVVMYHVAGLAI